MAWVTIRVDGPLYDTNTTGKWFVGQEGSGTNPPDFDITIECSTQGVANSIRDALNTAEE